VSKAKWDVIIFFNKQSGMLLPKNANVRM